VFSPSLVSAYAFPGLSACNGHVVDGTATSSDVGIDASAVFGGPVEEKTNQATRGLRCEAMRTELSPSEVSALALCDASLSSIAWHVGASPDISITLETARGRPLTLFFEWTTGLRIDLDWKENLHPLTWEVGFSSTDSGGWTVDFDFAHAGSIRFECNAVHVEAATT
jgi:hypothetical protein